MSARVPTILQIVPELETGGAELSAIEICEAITTAGGRALVVSEGGRMEEALAQAGGELIRLPVASKNPLQIWRNGQALAALARAQNADLLHARSRAPAWSTLIASRAARLPFITTYHGSYNEKGRIKRAYNSVMVRGRMVIANSAYTARLIEARYQTPRDKIRIIHRGVSASFNPDLVDAERITGIRTRWGVPSGKRIVLLAGRLTAWKGQTVLIDAFQRIAENVSAHDCVVVLAGDHQGRDGYRDGLVRQIADANLQDRVLLVGHENDMPAAFGAAHVAVVASSEPEAFGRTAVEAQAMGCPVIATRHGAPPETVLAPPETAKADQSGWLAIPGDAQDLAELLTAALEIPETERELIGNNARANVQANYTTELMKSKTLQVYNEILAETPKEAQFVGVSNG